MTIDTPRNVIQYLPISENSINGYCNDMGISDIRLIVDIPQKKGDPAWDQHAYDAKMLREAAAIRSGFASAADYDRALMWAGRFRRLTVEIGECCLLIAVSANLGEPYLAAVIALVEYRQDY